VRKEEVNPVGGEIVEEYRTAATAVVVAKHFVAKRRSHPVRLLDTAICTLGCV
jgi:hypothetical protein